MGGALYKQPVMLRNSVLWSGIVFKEICQAYKHMVPSGFARVQCADRSRNLKKINFSSVLKQGMNESSSSHSAVSRVAQTQPFVLCLTEARQLRRHMFLRMLVVPIHWTVHHIYINNTLRSHFIFFMYSMTLFLLKVMITYVYMLVAWKCLDEYISKLITGFLWGQYL